MPSFEERRSQARENSRVLIARAHTSDRQARTRARRRRAARPGFQNLPPNAQQAALEEAEEEVMQTRRNSGIDADSRITEALDAEASIMAQIEQEENGQKLRDLPRPSQTTTMSDDAQIGGAIAAIYRHNMGTMIERWERHITAAGPDIAPGIKEEELAQFRGRVSNPANVREFMERWAGEEGDVEEGLGEGEKGEGGNDDSDDLEIIISDDDDEDDEDEDEEMADFIVDDVEEDEEID